MKFRLFTLFVLLFISSVHSFAQQETQIGLAGILEEYPDRGFRFQGGLVIDQKLSKRSGFEIGLITRNRTRAWVVETTFENGNREIFNYSVKELYLNIPILYKFHTKIVNISIGPTLDVFTAWRQVDGKPDVVVEKYDVNPGFTFGFMGKISKDFELGEDYILEPEIRINPLNDLRTYIGLGLVLKYRVKKQE